MQLKWNDPSGMQVCTDMSCIQIPTCTLDPNAPRCQIPFSTIPNDGDYPPGYWLQLCNTLNGNLCTGNNNPSGILILPNTEVPPEVIEDYRKQCKEGNILVCDALVKILSPRCRYHNDDDACDELLELCNDGVNSACGRVRSRCSDDVLDQLETAKRAICRGIGCKATYKDPATGVDLETPCESLVESIIRAAQCRTAREQIIKDCYQGKPDKSHGYAEYLDVNEKIVLGELGQVFAALLGCAEIFYDINRSNPCNPGISHLHIDILFRESLLLRVRSYRRVRLYMEAYDESRVS